MKRDIKINTICIFIGLFIVALVAGYLNLDFDYIFGLAAVLIFAVIAIVVFRGVVKEGAEKRKYWEETSPVTATGHIDDAVVLYKRGQENEHQYDVYYVVSFLDSNGSVQCHLLKENVSDAKAKKNIGKRIAFEYIDDGYQSGPQLVLREGIFMGRRYNDLVGITEDMIDRNTVITLRDGRRTKDAYKLYSMKYQAAPPDYGPSILYNKNSRIKSPLEFID